MLYVEQFAFNNFRFTKVDIWLTFILHCFLFTPQWVKYTKHEIEKLYTKNKIHQHKNENIRKNNKKMNITRKKKQPTNNNNSNVISHP